MDPQFIENVISIHGQAGKIWLDNLPHIITAYTHKWSLTLGKPFHLTYNYVVEVIQPDQTPAVLKIGFPGDKEFLAEIEALETFNGNHVIRLLNSDKQNSVTLLERVKPGRQLTELSNDQEATIIACRLIKQVWQDAPQNSTHLIPIQKWHSGYGKFRALYNGTSGPLSEPLFSLCEDLFHTLIQTTPVPKLLHGDFHHGNILSCGTDDWKLIDPKGVIGDPIYDLAVFLYNPLPKLTQRPHLKQVLEKRIAIMSEELGFDKLRIVQWAMAQSMLSTIWSLEDNGEGWKYTLELTKLFKQIHDNLTQE